MRTGAAYFMTVMDATSSRHVVGADVRARRSSFWNTFMQGLPWTQLMDASLQAAHEELGAAEADVRAAARSTPFHPALREVPFMVPWQHVIVNFLQSQEHWGCRLWAPGVSPGLQLQSRARSHPRNTTTGIPVSSHPPRLHAVGGTALMSLVDCTDV